MNGEGGEDVLELFDLGLEGCGPGCELVVHDGLDHVDGGVQLVDVGVGVGMDSEPGVFLDDGDGFGGII